MRTLNHSSQRLATFVHAVFGMIATMVEYKDRLAEAMRDANVTAKGLAGELGLSYQAVKKVLDGKSASFTAQNHDLVATLLKVSSSWLANGIGSKNANSTYDQNMGTGGLLVLDEAHRALAPVGVGGAATQLATSVIGLSATRRKAIASLVAGLIESGPTAEEANAIDALAPGAQIATDASPSDWRHDAIELAKTHPDAPKLIAFLELVDQFRAGKIAAQREKLPQPAQAHR
jgi:hypothetical protein